MKRKVFVFCLLISLIFSIILTEAVFADFTLTPSILLKEEYNDNIYLTPDHEEDDLITTVAPSVSLDYQANLLTLNLNYTLFSKFYIHNSKENDFYHSATLDSTVNLYRDTLFIHITDHFKREPIDEKRQTGLDNILVNMTDSNTFTFNPYVVYPLTSTLQARADYIYENIWYEHHSGDDTKNHTFSLSLSKEFSETLKGTISYSYLIHKPRFTEEYDRQDLRADIEYEVGPALTLRGGLGHSWYNYDSSDIDDEDYNFWNAGLTYRLTEAVTADASYSLEHVESVTSGTYKNKKYEATLSYDKNITAKLRAFNTKAEYLESNREDKSTGVALDLSMPLTEKLTTSLTGTYTEYKFKPEDVKDKRYGLRASVDYELRIATLTVGYTYNKNNSTDDSKEYTNNIIWAETRISF